MIRVTKKENLFFFFFLGVAQMTIMNGASPNHTFWSGSFEMHCRISFWLEK